MYLKFSMEAFEIYECLFSQRNAHEQFFGVFVPTVIFSCNFLVFFVRENFKTYFIVYGKYNVKKNYVLENCSAQKNYPPEICPLENKSSEKVPLRKWPSRQTGLPRPGKLPYSIYLECCIMI